MDGRDESGITARVIGLVARYGHRTVLEGIDLAVRAGEVHVILGGSGCGKSTLLKHMIGLSRPAGGRVELLGVDLGEADEAERNAVLGRIGMLFQAGALLNSLTVAENVALPIVERGGHDPALVDEIVRMKLAMVDLRGREHLRPPELSGGMKKRAALARAMAIDPVALFCDEPGAGLDPISARALDRLLLNLRNRFGMSIVVVTHELHSIERIADRVTMLDKGRIVAQGTLAEVRAVDRPLVRGFFGGAGSASDRAESLMSRLAGGPR